MSLICSLSLVVGIATLIIVIVLVVKVYSFKGIFHTSNIQNIKERIKAKIYGNPGCDVTEQAACSQGMRGAGVCPPTVTANGKQIQCSACNDYEGEGCVPSNCVKTACM